MRADRGSLIVLERWRILVTLALVALFATPSTPRAAAGPQTLDAFLSRLESAIERNDRAAVAGMIHYPMKVLASGWIIPVDSPAAFLKIYDGAVTEDIKDLIAAAASRPRYVKRDAVFTLGKDSVRIMWMNTRFAIIGISVPPNSGKVRGARRGVTEVSMLSGHGTARFAGTLATGEHEAYVVPLRRNELLDVRVDGVRGRDIVARILDPTGQPVDQRSAAGSRVWTGRVPLAGDYRIDVVRELRGGETVLTYALAVSVR